MNSISSEGSSINLEATNLISSDGSSIDLEYAALTGQHDETLDDNDPKIGPVEDHAITLEKENLQKVPPTSTSTMKKCKRVEGASNGKLEGTYIQLMTSTHTLLIVLRC